MAKRSLVRQRSCWNLRVWDLHRSWNSALGIVLAVGSVGASSPFPGFWACSWCCGWDVPAFLCRNFIPKFPPNHFLPLHILVPAPSQPLWRRGDAPRSPWIFPFPGSLSVALAAPDAASRGTRGMFRDIPARCVWVIHPQLLQNPSGFGAHPIRGEGAEVLGSVLVLFPDKF